MKRGVLLIAHNNDTTNYYDMAVYTAKRVNKFLDLPVSVITDVDSITDDYVFDNTYIVEPNKKNKLGKSIWINKNRCNAYELSPYDQTLLLDVDYLINSSKLNKTFDLQSDLVCHYDIKYLMYDKNYEKISKKSFNTYWATVIRFNKSNKAEQVFKMMNVIQQNYNHYELLYNFYGHVFRNDYALTIALRTINGQHHVISDNIPWNLLHVNNNIEVFRETDTKYILVKTEEDKKTYIEISDTDIHLLNKNVFKSLMQ